MYFSETDTLSFIEENDIKFIRLSFCDIFGNMKNIAIMPRELDRALAYGIPVHSADMLEEKPQMLMLRPDTSSVSVLPWRPQSGRVVRFFCNLYQQDGSIYAGDLRRNLKAATEKLWQKGFQCEMSTRCEFYLFKTDMEGNPTRIPFDNGGYLDIAPLDKCEDTRREICLSLEEMGLSPTSSCHKSGPGQNEIDFASSHPLTAADNMMHYKTVVKTIAARNGLYASFSPKPLPEEIGSALKIYISISREGKSVFGSSFDTITDAGRSFVAGILKRIPEFTSFMNPIVNSYERFEAGCTTGEAPVLRLCYTPGCEPMLEVCSADAFCNPYLTFQLLLQAGMDGIEKGEVLSATEQDMLLLHLPGSLREAMRLTAGSDFVRENVPQAAAENFLRQKQAQVEAYEAAEDPHEYCCKYYF
ncbi:MAG: glutamine synthetase [Ruminococcus sp.]|nr:glutamine synthetase [Ruminococcus sp.]